MRPIRLRLPATSANLGPGFDAVGLAMGLWLTITAEVREGGGAPLTIEATGDYAGAKKMLETRGVMRPDIAATLKKVGDVPVDIAPRFVTADEIAPAGRETK